MSQTHTCDRCGLCCEQLIIEADSLDVLREPAIAERCQILDGRGKIPIEEASWSIAVGTARRCPFAGKDAAGLHTCSIYPTRPNVCVGFQPGSPKCQELRSDHGLSPLPATDVPGVIGQIRSRVNQLEEEEQ